MDDRDPRHVVKREALHAGASGLLYLGLLFLLWLVTRAVPQTWQRILLAVIIILAVIGNEIRDLHQGGSWQKSAIDLVVWSLALALLTWGIWWWERKS